MGAAGDRARSGQLPGCEPFPRGAALIRRMTADRAETPGREPAWRRLSRSPARAAVAAIVGASAAAAYAHFVGCRTGTCPLTSNVWTASLYGAAVGAVVGWPERRERAASAARTDGGLPADRT